jgi:hypothetical protein
MLSIVGDGDLRFYAEGAIDAIREELQGSNPLAYERDLTRRERFRFWLFLLSPSGNIRFYLRSRRAYREFIKAKLLAEHDESDPLVDDNKRN